MKILVLNTNERAANLNTYLTSSVLDGLIQSLGTDNVAVSSYADLLNDLYAFRPSALLCIDGQAVQRDILLQARKTGVPMVAWVAEDPFDLKSDLTNQDLFDVVFTNEISTVADYVEGKAIHLPLGASEQLCKLPVREDLWYDICVAGTAWPERVELCKRLFSSLPNLRWRIILATNDVIRDYDFPLPKAETDVRYPIQDLCRIYNRSALTINLRRSFSLGTRREALSPPPRVFETALAGTAQLVQTVNKDQLDDYFLPGVEIETFEDVAECVNKVKDILKNPDRRRKLALAAQQRTLQEHLYSSRVATILKWIEEHGRTPIKSRPSRNVLICAHSYFDRPGFGGVEILTEALARYLRNSWNVYLLYPAKDGTKWKLHDLARSIESEIPLQVLSRYETLSARSLHEALAFKEILLRNEVSFVYFEHLINFPLLLPLSASELGIPFALSFHDYYPICHKFNLIGSHNRYCHPDEIPLESCDICLKTTHGLELGAQNRRRKLMGQVMKKAYALHCASNWQKGLITSIYPDFEQKFEVIEPWCENGAVQKTAGTELERKRKLRVVIPGNIAFHKGADVLLEVAAHFAGVHADKIEFLVPHSIQSPWKENMASLPNVRLGTSKYELGEQLDVYKGADIALFLSIWPETFLISLSEAWRMLVPAIVTDLGAPSDRVKEGVNGWKVPPDQAGPVINILGRILDDPTMLATVRSNLKNERITSSQEHSRKIEASLERALEDGSVPNNRELTRSQLTWLKSQLDMWQPTIIEWSKPLAPYRPASKQRLGVEAFRYLRRFGIKKFFAAALMYASRKLEKSVSAAEADKFAR